LETYAYPDKKDLKAEEEIPYKENNHLIDALRYALTSESVIRQSQVAFQYKPIWK
jgi:hypothetical protein